MSDSDSIQTQIEHVKQRVNDAMAMAKSLGADGAEVAMSRQQGLSVSTRLGEVENVEFTSDGALGLRYIKKVVKVVLLRLICLKKP